MPVWACTACCRAHLGVRFEEKCIGGLGPKVCVVCGIVLERYPDMHYVNLPAEILQRRNTSPKNPIFR